MLSDFPAGWLYPDSLPRPRRLTHYVISDAGKLTGSGTVFWILLLPSGGGSIPCCHVSGSLKKARHVNKTNYHVLDIDPNLDLKKSDLADKRRDVYKTFDPAGQARRFAKHARADNTARTYKGAQGQYFAWCKRKGVEALPGTPEQIAEYLAFLAVERGHPPNTIRTKFAGIRRWYTEQVGFDNCTRAPFVRNVLSGIQRELAVRPEQATALTSNLIARIVAVVPEGIRGLRDKALLLVGYSGAFRRSEIAGLRVEDVRFVQESQAEIFLRSSKTDRAHVGTYVNIGAGPDGCCPVAALRAWLEIAPPGTFVFRPCNRLGMVDNRPLSTDRINNLVKELVALVDLDPVKYSAHSLRAGIATDLVEAGLTALEIQKCTRHRSAEMVQTYNRPASAKNFTQLAFEGKKHAPRKC